MWKGQLSNFSFQLSGFPEWIEKNDSHWEFFFFSVMLFLFICSDVAAVSNISASCLHQWNKLRDNEKEAAIEDLLFLTVNVVLVLSHSEGKWNGYYLRPISTFARFLVFRTQKKRKRKKVCVNWLFICHLFVLNLFEFIWCRHKCCSKTYSVQNRILSRFIWWRTCCPC